ncbi:transposase [Streptomyces hygroscopicus subsp. limoneus]|nr:transposase [Streptomyces hygroscopicus subsp. limoneus]
MKADSVREDRAWSLSREDRVLLVPRTGVPTSPHAGSHRCSVSKPAADRIVDHLEPALGLQPRRRYRESTVLIVDGTLVPARDRTVTASSGRQTSRGVLCVSHSGGPAPETGVRFENDLLAPPGRLERSRLWDQLHAVLLKKLRSPKQPD